jgi:prophage regulatory protein
MTNQNQAKILRLRAVCAMCGLSRSTIYARMAEGTFPKTIKLGKKAVGWLQSDISAWLDDCINASERGDYDSATSAVGGQ